MSELITMKSFHNGILLHLDDKADFEVILQEIAVKFENARRFFKDVSVALSIEGRKLSIEEEKQIVQMISAHSDVKIICIVGEDEETERKFVKALKRVEIEQEENCGRFHKGSLTDGQVLESEGSIVIIGNVEKGATVMAAKDIVVIGALYGEAYAGTDGEEGHIVVAMKFDPQKCKIRDSRFRGKDKGFFGKKDKYVPQVAYEKDNGIVVETITKELPGVFNM